ncbi:MAG: sulfurtransferase-like selenium metabolism protein YedF, partial [bacterium]|nr:sulfurtransferase-like selenium metabolism protein YedF [bacterium]
MKTVLVVNHDQMGHGDADLGRRLLSAYLGRMNRDSGLESIVLYNAGVKLATTDSP